MQWTIEAARAAQRVDRVIVSTDSEDYARIARQAGAEAPFLRPANLSGDEAGSESALLHVLDTLQDTEGYTPDRLVFLQCTSPFTLAEDIDGCLDALERQQADTAFTVTPSHAFLWKETPQGATGINHDKSRRLRRQEREPEFRETGAVYVMNTAGFREHRHRFFGKTVFQVVPGERSLEIDDEQDWLLCETLMLTRGEPLQRRNLLPGEPRAMVFDFDGVLTDNRVWVDQNGVESVACWRSDGLRLTELREKMPNLKLLILSKEQNPVVARRAEKLKLPVLHGIDEKVQVLDGWLKEHGIRWDQTIFVGNDLNDVDCLRRAGCGVAPADAYPEAAAAARLVLTRPGGHGAMRELIDLLLS